MADPVNNNTVNNDHRPRPVGPFKVIPVGVSGVGKTWFVHRAVEGTSPEYITSYTTLTLGANRKKVQISSKVEVTLEIWDTAGQERFNSLSYLYYRGAAAFLAVYDADHKHNIGDTLREISFHMFDDGHRNYSLRKPLVFLLATKTDLFSSSHHTTTQRPNTPRPEASKSSSSSSAAAAWPKELAFSDNEIQTLSEKYGVLISGRFCVSSKSGENVEETVRGIAELIVKARYPEICTDDDNSSKQTIQLHSPKERHAKKCAC